MDIGGLDIGWALNNTALWERQQDEPDGYGQPQYLPGELVSARIVRKPTLVRNADGVEVVSVTHCHIKHPVSVNDRITHDGKEYRVISVKDGLGLHDPDPSFYVAYL